MPKLLCHRIIVLLLLTFALGISSCKKPEKPLTKEEVQQFTRDIEISIGKREPKLMNDAMDEVTFLSRIKSTSQVDRKGIKRALGDKLNFGDVITNALSPKGSYELVRIFEKDKVFHALFRLYDGGSINYHDLELTRADGKVKIADMYVYLTGERMSETFSGILSQFEKADADPKAQWVKQLPRIRTLINTSQFKEAKDLFDEIPLEVQKGKSFQITNVQICSGLGDEEHDQALKQYEQLFPNEPNTQLLMLDGYFIRKEYDKVLKAVNELDKAVGTDPLLDYYRGISYSLLGDEAKSTECLERLNKNIPDFEDGVLELIATYYQEKKSEKAAPLVERYKSNSSFDQSKLEAVITAYGE